MRLIRTLALATVASAALLAGSANATTFILNSTPNTDGNNVAAQATYTTSGDHVTLTVTNTTAGMFASNQAITDVLLDFSTDATGLGAFTQDGQLADVATGGGVTNVAGDPTRWHISLLSGNVYLDALGGGQPSDMIASTNFGSTNGGFDNFNPYILGTATFTFDLLGASHLNLAALQFSFGTEHEFKAFGTCTVDCGVINPTGGGVPEPASWALMIVGFGGMGMTLRRRRAFAIA
jgi:hypothetical protein